MKAKLFLGILLAGIMGLASCSDFLDETPDKSGSAYIYHMDQLYGMMGSIDLYLLGGASESSISYGFVNDYWGEQVYLNDAVEFDPEFYVLGMKSGSNAYDIYSWNNEQLQDQYTMGLTWRPSWDRIYRFNTVLENLDLVQQTTQAVHDQVKGEAFFGRAYYHFILLVQYSLWDEDAPGIGYRDNTTAGEVPERQTVGYTLGRIYADLDSAQIALTAAGRTSFDIETNFRPTVPTVQAFRARVDLYRGNYESALQNATAALNAYNVLEDFKNNPEYTLYPSTEIYVLDETNSHVVDTIKTYTMMDLNNRRAEAVAEYTEFYLPSMTKENYYGRIPISEKFYNLWDRDNDARWLHFYSSYSPLLSASGAVTTETLINGTDTTVLYPCINYETQQWLNKQPWSCHNYRRFYCNAAGSLLGMTTAEMYLIKAECEARAGNTGAAAEDLKTLRRTRFYDQTAAEDVQGTVQEVLDERSREMGTVWRFFDIKRLNGAENAGISISREILTDPTDLNSVTILEVAPNDPRWALPFYNIEAELMGWEQNPGWD